VISFLELLATSFGFLYVLLIILRKPLGWIFGVLSSLIFVQISWEANLYLQTVLQCIYVLIGVFGFIRWKNENSVNKTLSKKQKTILYFLGIIISFLLGFSMSYTNQVFPYLDSFISIFGILATYLTTEKQIENWIIWIFVNLASIVLFTQQKLHLSAFLFVAYLLLSIIGLVTWNKEKMREKTN
jgi:nicotinamide mononucleotide transporter